MCKDFILTTDELFGSYCYIEQKRYGVPNEKFLYKIIGKFTSNAWSNVPVDANDKEPHIFNHSEEVVNVVCCGVCEDKIERYKLSDVEIISNKDQQLANLETKLAEYEKFMKDNEWDSLGEMQETLNKCEKKYFEIKKQLAEKDAERELDNSFWKQECDSLQKTLAEKEKEIESLRENSLSKRIFKEKLIPSHCMEQYEKYEQQIDKLTQDKILFAVEQLTQAIKNIKKCNYKDFGIMYQSDAIAVIDNQINELKGK